MEESKIKEWWDNNPQGYGEDLLSKHSKIDYTSKNFKKFLQLNDDNFVKAAYFAQKKNQNPFDLLIPTGSKNMTVLEIGCGLGFHTELLSKKFKRVVSIDLTNYSTEITKNRISNKGIKNVEVICCSATSIPLENETVDYVWSWGVLHHIPEIQKVLLEISRVLKYKGQFWGMFYNKNSIYNWLNVYLRYGIFKLEIFKLNSLELSSKYSDGKDFGGNPYTKFYSQEELNKLFYKFDLLFSHAFENKNIFLFFLNQKFKERISKYIPDKIMLFLFKKFGFLNYVRYQKK